MDAVSNTNLSLPFYCKESHKLGQEKKTSSHYIILTKYTFI